MLMVILKDFNRLANTPVTFFVTDKLGNDHLLKGPVTPNCLTQPQTPVGDPDGRFWIGTMSYRRTIGAASVYRWDGPGTRPVRAWGGATTANGLGFSPDGALGYWTDTPTRTVTVFDYDARAGLVNPRPFVEIEEGAGKPDGLCVDAEGGVWVALHRGSAVRRYDAEGRLSEVVELPVNKVTACTFGGEDLDRLYITTSRENLPDDVEPASGSVYLAEVGVKGLEPLAFAG